MARVEFEQQIRPGENQLAETSQIKLLSVKLDQSTFNSPLFVLTTHSGESFGARRESLIKGDEMCAAMPFVDREKRDFN